MPSSHATFMLGPLYCAWQPHAQGRSAERAVRSWLAQHLDCEADAIPLQRSARGRPQLAAPFEHLDVSWSHSGEQLLMVLGRRVQAGVDLERMRPRPRVLELAQRYFTPAETRWLSAHEDGGREEAFIRLWCAKEAVLKAHGYGLAFGLDRLAFAETREGLVLVECDAGLGTAKDWSLIEFVPAKAYRAALAWRPAR